MWAGQADVPGAVGMGLGTGAPLLRPVTTKQAPGHAVCVGCGLWRCSTPHLIAPSARSTRGVRVRPPRRGPPTKHPTSFHFVLPGPGVRMTSGPSQLGPSGLSPVRGLLCGGGAPLNRHRCGGAGGCPPPPPPKGAAEFPSGPSANQRFPLAPSAPVGLGQKFLQRL